MMPSFLRKYIALCHSKKGTGCQTVETSHKGRYRVPNSREISHRTLQVTRAKYQYSVFMFSWRGSRGSISFSRSDFSSLFDARGVTTAIKPTSDKQVSTPWRVLTLKPTLSTAYWTNSSWKVDTKVPCLRAAFWLYIVLPDEQNPWSDARCQWRRKGEKKLWCNWTTTPICKEWTFSAGFNKTENRILIDYFM